MDLETPPSSSNLSLPVLTSVTTDVDSRLPSDPAQDSSTASRTLTDTLSRQIGYLRLSLTQACAMRCIYCRPETNNNPRQENRLSSSQMIELVSHLVNHYGIQKVRLTGGDPTSHPEHLNIIRKIASLEGVQDLAMTTNGLTLVHRAEDYYNAGLNRLNISLDSLNAERFQRLTGINGMTRVLEGIDKALSLPFQKIKLNAVVIRHENDQELPDLMHYAADRKLDIRFIELMPMGPLVHEWNHRYVNEQRMKAILSPHITEWKELPQGHDAARSYQVRLKNSQQAKIGFITPMSCNFCASCNRIRVAADGRFYPCLMDRPTTNLSEAFDDVSQTLIPTRLHALLQSGLSHKAEEHPHDGYGIMTQIGG